MQQYVPRYTLAEQLKRILPVFAVMLPLIWFTQKYFFPWYADFAEVSMCFEFFGYRGDNYVLWFIISVPIITVTFITLAYSRMLRRAWNEQQFPPQGYKVYKKMRYQYGIKARLRVVAILLVNLLILSISLYSYMQLEPIFGAPISDMDALCEGAVMPEFFPKPATAQ